MEATMTGGVYLDMSEKFVYPRQRICSRTSSSSSSLHWERRVNILAPALAGYHCDKFIFLGLINDLEYATRMPDLPKLRESIRDMFVSVTPDMFDRAW
jgi:hypothetical protein